jgi:WD40 repeat protein/uncharacterized caspase-like protein
MGNNWAIVIGINHYEHLAPERHLRFAVRDAEKMKEFLCDRAGFPPENVLLCTDESPPVRHISTRPALTNLQRLLLEYIQHATEADNFWFFFAGHGMVGDDRQDYLLPCDGYPAYLKGSAISTTFVTECLRDCQAKNIVLILDMCRREGMDSSRGSGAEVGEQTIEIAKQQGIITIFSCDRGQLSYEIPALQQGAFTHTLLQGLQQHSLLRQLEAYLYREIPIVRRKYGIQVPIPQIVAGPAGRYDLPLLSGYTTNTDIAVLSDQATQAVVDAVTEEEYRKAKDLWWQVIDSSSSTQDQRANARRTIEKLDEKINLLKTVIRPERDEKKQTNSFPLPQIQPQDILCEPTISLPLSQNKDFNNRSRSRLLPQSPPSFQRTQRSSKKHNTDKSIEIEFEEALKFANKVFSRIKGGGFSSIHRNILRGAWHNWNYEQIAQISKCDLTSVKKHYAPRLWRDLSDALKEPINKSNFRRVMQRSLQSSSFEALNNYKKTQLINPQEINLTCVNTLAKHSGWISSIAISSDGGFLASGGLDNTLGIWNLESGEFKNFLGNWWNKPHSKPVQSIAFSPNSRILASGSDDATVRIWAWNTNTGKYWCKPFEHRDAVYSVSISPDNQTVVSGSADKTIRIWSLQTKECVRVLTRHQGPVKSVILSPDGQKMVSASADRTIRIWDANTWTLLDTLPEPMSSMSSIDSLTFSNSGGILAIGYTDEMIRLIDFYTGQLLYDLPGSTVAISPDEKLLAISFNKEIRIYELNEFRLLCSIKTRADFVKCLSFAPNGKILISGNGSLIKIWQIGEAQT